MKTLMNIATSIWEWYTSLGTLIITLSIIALLLLLMFITMVYLKNRKEELRRIEHNRKHMNNRLRRFSNNQQIN